MKKIYSLLACCACAFGIASCDDMMDVHKEYIESGEIIYAPKADSIAFKAGKGRIEFYCRVYKAVNVESVNLYWNDRADSLVTPLNFQPDENGYDEITVTIPDLEEKSYTFEVQLVDKFGHRSLTTTDFGTSYGENYRAGLNDRRIKEVNLTGTAEGVMGQIDWYTGAEGLVANEISYMQSNGTRDTIRVEAGESMVKLPGAKPGSKISYRSVYIPEENSIDEFYTEWVTAEEESFPSEYLMYRGGWKVLAASDADASDGQGKDAIIDGNTGTYWHSNWHGTTTWPHWLIIEMDNNEGVDISKMELLRRNSNNDIKTVEVYLGPTPEADATDWTLIGTVDFGSADKSVTLASAEVSEGIKTSEIQGKYLKLLVTASNRQPHTNIMEFYLYAR